MNRELKKKYVAELRNPERKQCFEKLRDPDTGAFCAIGLLLDIVDPNGWSSEPWDRIHNLASPETEETTDEFDDIIIGDRKVACEIMQANDEGLTFDQIANIVELNAPEDDNPVNVQKVWDKITQREHDREADLEAEACCCPKCADNE